MKRIFTFSIIAIFIGALFTSCIKTVNDDQYWMTKERGQVVYSSPTCSYYVVETSRGFTIIRAYNIKDRPYNGDIIYGDLSYYGLKDFYNSTDGTIISGDVKEYWLTYSQAQSALDYYCY
ncbi:MAG: hypothetical protein C4308_11845 [Chitinophagaceae bacterium]